MQLSPFSYKAQQRGITIIEVLVAMLILSVGLLGMASLQVRAVQDTTNSSYRSIAIYYANDMVDRMRANSGELATGGAFDEGVDADGNPTGKVAVPTADPNNATCLTSGCTSTELAEQDMYDWSQNLAAALPAGTGTVGKNGNVYTVTVQWTDRVAAQGADTDQSTVTLNFEP